MSIKKLVALLLCVLWVPVFADVQLNPNHPESYTVRKGDTLWDISARFLTKPWLWPEIWQVNPQIKNPHLIYPGDVISLAYKNGKPVLELHRGREVKLEPQIRSYPHRQAIQTIPLDAIGPFLSRPRVVTKQQIQDSPYVLSTFEGHLIAGADNKIYVRGIKDDSITHYTVYRTGKVYRNPGAAKDDILGYELLQVGDAVVERFGDPATLRLVDSRREVLAGDRLMPEGKEADTNFVPSAPNHEVKGNIISVVDGVSQIGQYQVVVLNLGTQEGIKPGNVLSVYQSGGVVTDHFARRYGKSKPIRFAHADSNPVDMALGNVFTDIRNSWRGFVGNSDAGVPVRLPEEHAGEVMVFRTFDKVSYALVMRTERPLHIDDSVRTPE